MRTLILILTTTLLFNCSDKKIPKTNTMYYYLMTSDRSNQIDTIKYSDFNSIDTADQFIGKSVFYDNKKGHLLQAFASDNHAPVDGGRLYYTLDSIGIIYSRSTTWYTSVRLISNNDSINNLLSQALGV